MDRLKKVDFQKKLVRNTAQPIHKIFPVASSSDKANKKPENKIATNKKLYVDCKVDKPELQSTLKLSKDIDDLVKQKITKSLTDTKKLAVDEKVTRKVNFPYDHHIYKDLIPLEVDQCKSSQVITSRGPLPHKDNEPVLSDFLEVRTMPKYFCLPHIKLENKLNTVTCNNLRLYHIIEKHDGLKQ